MKYVHQASVCKPHTITRSQAGSLHYTDKPSILPEQFHRRKSEKRVRDEVYCTMAELSGYVLTKKYRLPFKLLGIHCSVQSGSFPENWTKITKI